MIDLCRFEGNGWIFQVSEEVLSLIVRTVDNESCKWILSSVTQAKDVKSVCNASHNDYRVVFFQFHPSNHA